MAGYRDPFTVLPAYEAGHWDVTMMFALEAFAASAVEREDWDLLAASLAAWAIACRGGVGALIDTASWPEYPGLTQRLELCARTVRGRPRKGLSARGRTMLGVVRAVSAMGVMDDRAWMLAAHDPWRRANGYEAQASPALAT
jgi:hypothetical protein